MVGFFRLVSSAFAKIEGCSIVPNTPENKEELCLEIKRKKRIKLYRKDGKLVKCPCLY